MRKVLSTSLIVMLLLCVSTISTAENEQQEPKVNKTANTYYISNVVSDDIKIDNVFGTTQCIVDAQIYEGMRSVCTEQQLISIFGNVGTPVFEMACDTINPCMVFATSKGEAGGRTSEPGVSMTTVIATNSRYYSVPIDWIYVTANLSQVDEMWYYTNCDENVSDNVEYNSYLMPVSYLQNGGSDGLGIGPYQITSNDWERWTLEDRMSPTRGWVASLKKGGTGWLNSGVEPISDITIMAMLAMNHQGGAIISSDVGRNIISFINTEEIQEHMKGYAYRMYQDVYNKAFSGSLVSADDINPAKYIEDFYNSCGVRFSQWSYGSNSTNTGNYVVAHTLQYIFYKYYFGLEA